MAYGRGGRPAEALSATRIAGGSSPAAGIGGGSPGTGGGGGRALPSFFAKNVSRACLATTAADDPCSPCSAKITPAICGLSRGARNTNQPWSLRFLEVFPLAALAPSSEITWAVPVLPETS